MTNELPESFKICIPKDHISIILNKLSQLGIAYCINNEGNFVVVRGKDVFLYKTINCFIADPAPEVTITQFMSYTNKKETEIENKESLKKLSECLDEALRLTDILSVNMFGKVFL